MKVIPGRIPSRGVCVTGPVEAPSPSCTAASHSPGPPVQEVLLIPTNEARRCFTPEILSLRRK